jgi:hypothetical protein
VVEDHPLPVAPRVVGNTVDGQPPDTHQLSHVAGQLPQVIDILEQPFQLVIPTLFRLLSLLTVLIVAVLLDDFEFALHLPLFVDGVQALLDVQLLNRA